MAHSNDRLRCSECNRSIAKDDPKAVINEKATFCKNCAEEYQELFDDTDTIIGPPHTLNVGCLGVIVVLALFWTAVLVRL